MDDKESAYIVHQRQRESGARDAETLIQSIVARYMTMDDAELPPTWMMNKIGSHSAEHFRKTGSWTFVELLKRGKVTPESRVVDIGSGCGRLAIPFSLYIKNGSYFGTDVFEDGVKWCAENISVKNPNFKFFLQVVENNYYFGGAAKPSANLSLSFADTSSIDLVFAISVFTHLVEADAQTYLHEISRCLQPNGIAYVTCFIIDRTFGSFVKRSGLHSAVQLVSEGHYQAYSGQDFFGGYDMPRWRQMVDQAGLEIAGFDPGTWAEKLGAIQYQDTFILTKKP